MKLTKFEFTVALIATSLVCASTVVQLLDIPPIPPKAAVGIKPIQNEVHPPARISPTIPTPKNVAGKHVTATGPSFPGAGTSDSSYGTRVWNDPGDTDADDTLYATVSCNDDAQLSQYLKVTDFGFSLASDQDIDGVEVTINRMRGIGPSLKDNRVRLTIGGTVMGEDKADTATNWPTITPADKVYGGASDLWTIPWTYSQINDSTFGVVLAVIGDDSALASVDYITITVYHHTDPGFDADVVGGMENPASGWWLAEYRRIKSGLFDRPLFDPRKLWQPRPIFQPISRTIISREIVSLANTRRRSAR